MAWSSRHGGAVDFLRTCCLRTRPKTPGNWLTWPVAMIPVALVGPCSRFACGTPAAPKKATTSECRSRSRPTKLSSEASKLGRCSSRSAICSTQYSPCRIREGVFERQAFPAPGNPAGVVDHPEARSPSISKLVPVELAHRLVRAQEHLALAPGLIVAPRTTSQMSCTAGPVIMSSRSRKNGDPHGIVARHACSHVTYCRVAVAMDTQRPRARRRGRSRRRRLNEIAVARGSPRGKQSALLEQRERSFPGRRR